MTKFELRVLSIEATHASQVAVKLMDAFHNALREFLGEPTEAEIAEAEPELRADLLRRMTGVLVEAIASRAEAVEEAEPDYEPNGSLPSFEDFLKSIGVNSAVAETDLHVDFVKPGETETHGIVMMIKRHRETKEFKHPITVRVDDGRFVDVEFSELVDKSKVDINEFCDKNDK